MAQRLPTIAYNLALAAYRTAAQTLAHFSPKAQKFVDGRKGLLAKIEAAFKEEKRPVIWMHCASLGEFEQGRPVLEALREKHLEYAFLLTFFSPSGYEVRKDYAGTDYVFYLPHDTPANAADFIRITRPVLALMVKYDLWLHYLEALKAAEIPVVLFAARFTPKHGFFRWYGSVQRRMLRLLTHIFVQDEASQKLLQENGFNAVSVAGDTRFDRVAEAAKTAAEHPTLLAFAQGAPLLIAGSTWPQDEALLEQILPQLPPEWKLVIVPHEVDEAHLQKIETLFGKDILRWGDVDKRETRVLLVDRVGLLLQLYKSATIAYLGGGFGRAGVHNVLEPAAMGAPVIHGPIFHQFLEAEELVRQGGAEVVKNAAETEVAFHCWTTDEKARKKAGEKARQYVQLQRGATEKIVRFLEKFLPHSAVS